MSELDQRRVAKAFGAELRSTGTGAGITQEKLAELANIDRTYPSMLERGLRQPTLGRVIAIADALHIEPAVLVTSTVARLRAEGAANPLAHATSAPSTAQHHARAPGGHCHAEREPLIFNGSRKSAREAL
jgi:transcriptional regulator with XRE-family HTH domain